MSFPSVHIPRQKDEFLVRVLKGVHVDFNKIPEVISLQKRKVYICWLVTLVVSVHDQRVLFRAEKPAYGGESTWYSKAVCPIARKQREKERNSKGPRSPNTP